MPDIGMTKTFKAGISRILKFAIIQPVYAPAHL
jgi:hypothetical protein